MSAEHNRVDDVLVPALAREATYELLALASPLRVVVDTGLAPGTWYVVRAAPRRAVPRTDRVTVRRAP